MMDRKAEFSPLRLGVGTIIWKSIENGDREILLGKRMTHPVGKWALPGGTMDDEVSAPLALDKDKDIKIAAAREILEEAGIEISPRGLKVISIDDSDIGESKYLNFGCQIEVPKDTEVNLSRASHGYEMSEWKWFSLKDFNDFNEVFAPCVPTIKSFIHGKIQVK